MALTLWKILNGPSLHRVGWAICVPAGKNLWKVAVLKKFNFFASKTYCFRFNDALYTAVSSSVCHLLVLRASREYGKQESVPSDRL